MGGTGDRDPLPGELLPRPEPIDEWDGDAPIAAPLDPPPAPKQPSLPPLRPPPNARSSVGPPSLLDEIHETTRPTPDAPTEVSVPILGDDLARAVTAPAPPARSPVDEAVLQALSREEVIHRPLPRAPSRIPSNISRRPLAREGSRTRPGSKVPREYPAMRALLRDPDRLPAAPEDRTVEARAFIKSSPRPPPREQGTRAPLDDMLEQMAEGLLVGGDGDQLSEMRVTLRDEFFKGTELRISVGPDGVTARFLPPERDTYRHLAAELPRLRNHLADRGLRVGKLEVAEPE